jgi:C1A family cysteine protease
MKLASILLFFPILAGAFNPAIVDITPTPCWSEFLEFQQTYDKHYNSLREHMSRFQIFEDNCLRILNHGTTESSTFNVGFNQFSDLTAAEFDTQYKGYGSVQCEGELCESIVPKGCDSFESYMQLSTDSSSDSSSDSSDDLPDSVDWRTANVVTPVKDQGSCGSCWSFSTTGSIEGAYAIQTGNLVSLSEQQLVDCSTTYDEEGCNGGLMDYAFDYVEENGLCTEDEYPYTAVDGTCAVDTCSTGGVTLSGCVDVTTNNQTALKEAVNIGPVSIAIEADTMTFQFYSDGVITSDKCGTNLDHGVLIVGYGTEDGQDYWLVKNSWGDTWGDEGYVKIARTDSVSDEGICGIAMSASFPVM